MKNNYLLHRSGRNQYGIKNDVPQPNYSPSKEVIEKSNDMQALHIKLNEEFIEKYNAQWSLLFEGMTTKKEIWSYLYPHKKPSQSTFNKKSRDFSSLDNYLNYLLVQNKTWSLIKLGYDINEIQVILKDFKECGRYMVKYKSGSSFATSI